MVVKGRWFRDQAMVEQSPRFEDFTRDLACTVAVDLLEGKELHEYFALSN